MSVTELRARHEARVEELVRAALEWRPAGDDRWDALLSGLGLKPMSAEQRLRLFQSSRTQLRGALPVELRGALEVIREHSSRALRALDVADDEDARARFERELEAFVDRELGAYIDRTRPTTTVSSIFANARSTTVTFGGAKDQLKARRCRTCGAARPEGTDLRRCAFCGQDLFKHGRDEGAP